MLHFMQFLVASNYPFLSCFFLCFQCEFIRKVLGPAAIALAHLALHPEARMYMYDSGATSALVRQVLECKSPSVRDRKKKKEKLRHSASFHSAANSYSK